MKNFSLRTRKSSRQGSDRKELLRVTLLILGAIAAVVFARSLLGNALGSIAEFVFRVEDYFAHSTAVLPSYIRERSVLVDEIERLNAELSAGSGNLSTIARVTAENTELKALLSESSEERIVAGVIARPPRVPYDLLVIDKGSAAGIKEGAAVYLAHNHAIGLVSHVYERMSLVTLFSTNGVESTVYLYGPNVFAYAYGEGGGVIRISVPQGVAVHEGDAVVLPSLGSGDIGIVSHVVSLPTQPEQNAFLTLPLSIQSIHAVTVGKEAINPPSYEDMVANVTLLTERLKVEVPEASLLGSTSTTIGAQAGTTTPQ